MKRLLIIVMLLLCAALPALAEDVPYILRVTRPDEPIFSGPSYDEFCVGTVKKAGAYTIVEEVDDGEGNLWGRLKSGAGWIDLNHARLKLPVSAGYAQDALQDGEDGHFYALEHSGDAVWILFRACEPLTDVSLVALDVADESLAVGETLYTLAEMTEEHPLLAGVVFYGDMTAYGLRFTDSTGTARCFAASISGRNGMLVLDEWAMAPGPDGTLLLTDTLD